MITTHPENNDEAEEAVLAQNLNGLDEDTNENDLIKLLARIVREQNKEINNILISQNDRAKQQAEEQRHLVDMVEKLEAKLSSFIDSHGSSCDDTTSTARSDMDLILLLRSKVDALEHTASHIEGLTTHVHNLETQVTSLEDRLRQTVQLVNESNPKGLNAEDLQSLTEALATRQLSMQFRIDEHAETLNRLLSARDGSSSQVDQEPKPTLPLSHRRSVTHHERESVSSQSTYNSPHRHARTPSSLGTLSNASPRRSQTATASDSGHSAPNSHQQTTELIQKAAQHDSSLSSNRKEILNLKRRLAHAERLIGARYQIGAFSIHGLSFYQDAAALRYMSDPAARDAFRMFYGSRIAAVDYAEIAPTAILTCFDIISRVRCRHDMWTDDKLEVKQRIRCTAEAIVDYWMQSLPLRDGGEHIHVSARELQSRFNQLRLLCMQHDVEFDFIWPTV